MAGRYPPHHLDTVAASLRYKGKLALLSPLNKKSPKGEKLGYLTAMLYLAPASVAGGKSVCPHSTEACRQGCLFTAGRGKTTRVHDARVRRTRLYLEDRALFMSTLMADLGVMQTTADQHEMTLAIRLNGTSDIGWERERFGGLSVFEKFPRAIFYDYTRWPAAHRRVPENWRLTFSLADEPIDFALEHLHAGRSVAAVVPDLERVGAPDWFAFGDQTVHVVDGELHDLRFLDEAPSLVLLKPKVRLRNGGPMVRRGLIAELMKHQRERAPCT